MESYIRGLQSLGQGQDSFGNQLVPVILEKLPADVEWTWPVTMATINGNYKI